MKAVEKVSPVRIGVKAKDRNLGFICREIVFETIAMNKVTRGESVGKGGKMSRIKP